MKKKKFVKPKRDWKKHPDLYDYLYNEERIEDELVDIFYIVADHQEGTTTALEALCEIAKITRNYNKDLAENLFLDKILNGRVKPRNKNEEKLLKEHKKSEERRKIQLREENKEQKKNDKFIKLMDKK